MSKQRRSAAPAADRAARVIQRTLEIQAKGARGWSDAMAKARKETK